MRTKNKILWLFMTWVAWFFTSQAFANVSLFYKEANLVGGYSSQEQWIDQSGMQASSIGFEDYRKFSNDFGDYLTTDLQMRIAYDSLESSDDAWSLQVHNAYLEHKMFSGMNVRVGHFDPAFGLEPLLDTHGTLLQTLAMKDIGFTKDWGVGFDGSLPKFDYKLALQLGSGMSVYRKDGSFLLTSRIGSPKSQNFQYGASLLYGQVLETMGMRTFPKDDLLSDESILKERIGFDSQYLWGPYLFKGEVSLGANDEKDVLGYLGELDYTFPRHQNLELELQFQSWMNELGEKSSDDSTLTAGASYKVNQSTTWRLAFSYDFNRMDEREENKAVVQFYYFGL